jgi:hypothetical protein
MKKAITAIVFTFMVFSCKKRDVRSDLEIKWQNCRDLYDKTITLEKMQGRWKYIAWGCAYCSKPGIHQAGENVEIIITKDKQVSTYEDGLLLKTSNFDLNGSYNDGFYTLETNPKYENTYTYGIVEICQGSLAFRNSYVDGADFYFEKVK